MSVGQNPLTQFRETKIGKLPIDWSTKYLRDIGECIIGLTYAPENVVDDNNKGVLVLRSSNIRNGHLDYDDNVYVASAIPNKLFVKDGDILVCVRNGSRNLIGKSALIDKSAVGATFGAFMSVYRTEFSAYIFHLFQTDVIKRQIAQNLGATINQITNKNLNSFLIPFPPLPEQRKIAEILSTWDQAIDLTRQLIAAKQQLKKGLMQRLLLGKVRFPEFVESYEFRTSSGTDIYPVDWKKYEFGDFVSRGTRKFDPRNKETNYPCIELEHVEQGTGRISGTISTEYQKSIKTVFISGDILFGKLRPYLRKYAQPTFDGVCSSEIWVFSGNKRLCENNFLFYLVQMPAFLMAANVTSGTKMPRADWDHVSESVWALPSIPEQRKMVEVLQNCDAEINLLAQKLDLLQQQKKGLMQQLLTGNIRVKPD